VAKSKRTRAEPLYTWAFKSSVPRNGGQFVFYITQLNPDYTLSCNCPGWVYSKEKPKACKHTRDDDVQGNLSELLEAIRTGQALPTIDMSDDKTGPVETSTAPSTGGNSKIKYGRVIEI
jgi:hypothetical protein